MQMLDFARSNHLPYRWRRRRPARPSRDAARPVSLAGQSCVARPEARSRGLSDRVGIGIARRLTWSSSAAAPLASAPLLRGVRRTRHARHGEQRAGGPGGRVPSDRELPWFPAGITGAELSGRAITQARKFDARMAAPYRVVALEPGTERHVLRLGRVRRSLPGRSCSRAGGVPPSPRSRTCRVRGALCLHAAGPSRGSPLRRRTRRRRRRRQLGRSSGRVALAGRGARLALASSGESP